MSTPNSPSLTPLRASAPSPLAASSEASSSNSPRANQTHLGDLFGLHEPLLADFSCALLDKIRYVGRLYVFPAHVAFSSSVFGDTKLVLPLVELRALNRKKSVLVVPDAIELVCGEPSLPLDQCETFVFASFFNRELAFTTLERAWHAANAPPPAVPPPVPPSPTPHDLPSSVPNEADTASTADTKLASSAPIAIPAVVVPTADDSVTRQRSSPLSHSANKRPRRPATMPSVLPSLMPENDDDALPFISTGCPHVTNSSVDEVFTSESATGSTTIQQELPNCSLAFVWHTLFKTTAFWRHVHSKNGFLDFEGSPWRARTASDSSGNSGNIAGAGGDGGGASGGAGSGGDAEYKPATCCVERLITFKVSLSQPVGPKSTRMTQTLVARFVTARRLVIETVSQCHDAPYADSFLVNSMLVVDEKHDGSCLLRIWWGVRFLRTVWMVKGLIESTALRDNQQFYGLWSLEALTALHERRIGAAVVESDDAAAAAMVEMAPRSAEPVSEEREVVQHIQHIVVGDNPPMLARSVVMSLSGVVLLWLAWWGVSALSTSGAPPPDDPVRQLREHVTRLEARIDTLSAALTRVAHLLPDDRREQVHTVLSTLESSAQTQAASSSFGARMLIHRAAQLSGSAEDARTVALLSDALEQMARVSPPQGNQQWSSTTMSFVTIVVAILVSVAIAARH